MSTRPTDSDFFVEHLGEVPVLAILRGLDPDAAVQAARTAWDSGVPLVEVTLERPEGADALQAVVDAAPAGIPVGAGTLTTPERLDVALRLGARFGVAPGLDQETVRAAQMHRMPFLPGVATPTEAGQALRLGVTTVKAFPASSLGPSWIRALAGPFPEIRVVATGGVTPETAAQFLDVGALGVGLGSALGGSGLRDLVSRFGTGGTGNL